MGLSPLWCDNQAAMKIIMMLNVTKAQLYRLATSLHSGKHQKSPFFVIMRPPGKIWILYQIYCAAWSIRSNVLRWVWKQLSLPLQGRVLPMAYYKCQARIVAHESSTTWRPFFHRFRTPPKHRSLRRCDGTVSKAPENWQINKAFSSPYPPPHIYHFGAPFIRLGKNPNLFKHLS